MTDSTPTAPPTPASEKTRPAWSWIKRLLFWIGLSYVLLYTLPFPLNYLPTYEAYDERVGQPDLPQWMEQGLEGWDDGLRWITTATTDAWEWAVLLVGEDWMGIEVVIEPTGSGDTTFAYVQGLIQIALAVVLGALISLLFRRRTPPRFMRWSLYTYARYFVAVQAFTYGIIKVIKTQFPQPFLERLIQPYGESSPMGLIWTQIGLSEPYNWFIGSGEILCGLLLIFRRTTTLGSLMTIAVMGQVAAINYCYDVPVKLFSTHLLLMGAGLAALDCKRLMRTFFLNRSTEPIERRPLFTRRVPRLGGFLLKLSIIVTAIWADVDRSLMYYDMFEGAPEPQFYGIWEVDRFVKDGEEQPPVLTDSYRWRRMVHDKYQFGDELHANIHRMNKGNRARYRIEVLDELRDENDEVTQAPSIRFTTTMADPEQQSTLRYEWIDEEHLRLIGEFEGAEVEIEMSRRRPKDFLLTNRGYHWINEQAFNR